MKAVAVLASPRTDGNSAKIASTFMEACKQKGCDTQCYALNNLEFKGCQACMKCKTVMDKCGYIDQLTDVLEAVSSTDILVLAAPIYFGQVNGQAKCFIDRTYSFLKPDFISNPNASRIAPGKKMVLILTQGDPGLSTYDQVFADCAETFKGYGFEVHGIRGAGLNDKNEAEAKGFLLEEARKLADKLC